MGFIIATLIVLVVIASVVAQDFSIFSWAYWQEGDTSTSRSEVFRNGGLFLAALFGLGFAFWRARIATRQAEAAAARADAAIDQARAANEQARAANEQARIAEQGHITERFSHALEQLGHDRVAVRIGGLYALQRIAEDSVERDHLAVMDVLTNFIRLPPYIDEQREAAEREKTWREFKADPSTAAAAPPPQLEFIDCPDIFVAIEIIQGRSEDQKAVEKKRMYRLSLSRASLSYLRLLEVNLLNFDLAAANLTGAELTDAQLTNTDLRGADLTFANLSRAILPAARLAYADLTEAELTNANLLRADLTRADLTDANLTDANLTYANHLTQDQLDYACIRKGGTPPRLPEGLKPPQKVCAPVIA